VQNRKKQAAKGLIFVNGTIVFLVDFTKMKSYDSEMHPLATYFLIFANDYDWFYANSAQSQFAINTMCPLLLQCWI